MLRQNVFPWRILSLSPSVPQRVFQVRTSDARAVPDTRKKAPAKSRAPFLIPGQTRQASERCSYHNRYGNSIQERHRIMYQDETCGMLATSTEGRRKMAAG